MTPSKISQSGHHQNMWADCRIGIGSGSDDPSVGGGTGGGGSGVGMQTGTGFGKSIRGSGGRFVLRVDAISASIADASDRRPSPHVVASVETS